MTFYSGLLSNPGSTNTKLTNTSATVVVASADQSQSVGKVHIANVDGAAPVVVSVDIHNGSSVVAILISGLSLASAGGYVDIYDILLDQGQSLRVTSGDADGQLHVHAIHSLTNIPGS